MKKNINSPQITTEKKNKVQIPRRLSPLPSPIVIEHLAKLNRPKPQQRTRKALSPIPTSQKNTQQLRQLWGNKTLEKPVLKPPTLSQIFEFYTKFGKEQATAPGNKRTTSKRSRKQTNDKTPIVSIVTAHR